FALSLKHQIRSGERDEVREASRREHRYRIGSAGAPVVAHEQHFLNVEGVGEIEDVLRERGGLATHGVGIFHVGRAETAEVRDDEAQSIVLEATDDFVPGTPAVREAVKE